jgi:fatty-acyl-CoA synthase/long-chain acyl-CoA synthetase
MSPERAPDVLTLHAANQPEKPAVVDDRPDGRVTRWSFAELEAQANRLAHVLRDLGLRRGDKLVWCGPNSPGIVRAMHAARKIGAVAVPLNYRLAPEEAAYVVDHCDAVLVYTDAEYADLFSKIRGDIPRVRDVLVFDGEPGPSQEQVEPGLAAAPDTPPEDDGATGEAGTMIYTSGTTGRPKGALREGLGDRSQVLAMIEFIGYRPDDVYLTTGPLYHSGPGGFMSIAHTLGQTVVTQRRFDAEDWLRLVDRHRVTSTFSAPTPIRLVCNLPAATKDRYDRSSMRIMIANAAPWSYALKLAYLDDFPEDSLFEVYGSTELGVNAILRPEDQRRKKGSCGQPSPGVELALFDDDGQRIEAPHTPGELFARSKSIFTTYYKARDKFEEERRGEFHTVGDVAYFDEEGFFYICDRKKDMVISGGMNIYPAEIEAALEHHPAIHDAAVFGIPSEEWGESVHAVVVLNPGHGLSPDDVVDYAREHLAGYKIPRSVSFRNDLPRTGSGKILKRELREPWWRDHESRVL